MIVNNFSIYKNLYDIQKCNAKKINCFLYGKICYNIYRYCYF